MLGGDTSVEPTPDGVAPHNADAYQFTASNSGTANQLSLYLDASSTATQVQVGLYSNDSSSGQNHPGTLLTSATIAAPVAGAWNQVTLAGVALTAGQTYWIALMDPTGASGLTVDIASGSGMAAESNNTVGSSLPATWTTTAQWGALKLSAYVSQVGTGTTTTTLAANITYTGFGGAAGSITGMQQGNGVYTYGASYDFNHRLTSSGLTRASDSTVLFQTQPGYDAVGNVTSVLTTLPAGTDNQAFCSDEQNRLTWASSASGAIPCGGTNAAGSLTAAQYTQSFASDTLGRLTSGPLGSATYGDSAHKHAATAIGATWTAAYDAAGDMTCRAPDATKTCTGGAPTGQQLGFDAEGWLKAWQNAPTSPTSTAQYLYDGDGTRVAQQVTSGGATTTTAYIGTVEEVAVSGASTTTTTYYYAGDIRVALAVNGVFSYLGDDVLGSATTAFDAAGAVQASQLYAPYGGSRYSNGTMPGSFGFTGQRADAATGLDYYVARYYDPLAAQFTSADTVLPGDGYDPWALLRYAYVEGNPIAQ